VTERLKIAIYILALWYVPNYFAAMPMNDPMTDGVKWIMATLTIDLRTFAVISTIVIADTIAVGF
jgi:hypothetical protein